MKKALAVAFALSLASSVFAQSEPPRHQRTEPRPDDSIGAETLKKFPINPDGDNTIRAMIDENDENLPITANQRFAVAPEALRPAPLAVNLTYHGGDVINTAQASSASSGVRRGPRAAATTRAPRPSSRSAISSVRARTTRC